MQRGLLGAARPGVARCWGRRCGPTSEPRLGRCDIPSSSSSLYLLGRARQLSDPSGREADRVGSVAPTPKEQQSQGAESSSGAAEQPNPFEVPTPTWQQIFIAPLGSPIFVCLLVALVPAMWYGSKAENRLITENERLKEERLRRRQAASASKAADAVEE
mmetsp:Transcript_7657/g.28053  ORF Transcript_7657/g.28053 Transcript_7657/m.28053 type:complete len:160 (+) Transcript_7657:64-543(+)